MRLLGVSYLGPKRGRHVPGDIGQHDGGAPVLVARRGSLGEGHPFVAVFADRRLRLFPILLDALAQRIHQAEHLADFSAGR